MISFKAIQLYLPDHLDLHCRLFLQAGLFDPADKDILLSFVLHTQIDLNILNNSFLYEKRSYEGLIHYQKRKNISKE